MEELKPIEKSEVSRIEQRLWELYDKFEDANHVVCGDAANLIDTLYRRTEPENKANSIKECPHMQRVEGGIPYCEEKQTACDGCAELENKPQELCSKDENFIQTKFGYCFYTLDSNPLIYNLYVHPQYRRCGHSNTLLRLAIGRIRGNGYKGDIRIQAEPRENSIGLEDLTKYYKSMGLIVEYPQT